MKDNGLRRSVLSTPSEVVFLESVPLRDLVLKGAQPRV
jgi:hypothetical protein